MSTATTMRFFWETDSGASGWYEAESIEEARSMFAFEHPEISPESAGVWGPGDAEYPRPFAATETETAQEQAEEQG